MLSIPLPNPLPFEDWPVLDIVDVHGVFNSEFAGSNGYRATVSDEMAPWLQEVPRHPAMPSVSIFGAPYRDVHQWTDAKAVDVLRDYHGIFANLPYFFCDNHAKDDESALLVANSLIKPPSDFNEKFVTPILNFLRWEYVAGKTTSPARLSPRTVVAIHRRASTIYSSIYGDHGPTQLFIETIQPALSESLTNGRDLGTYFLVYCLGDGKTVWFTTAAPTSRDMGLLCVITLSIVEYSDLHRIGRCARAAERAAGSKSYRGNKRRHHRAWVMGPTACQCVECPFVFQSDHD
jgi:hypothetical protein